MLYDSSGLALRYSPNGLSSGCGMTARTCGRGRWDGWTIPGPLLHWYRCFLCRRSSRMYLLRLRHQLLQFSFYRLIAHMLILQHTVGIDAEGVGDRIDPESCSDGTIPAGIPGLHPGHLVLGNKTFPFALVGIQADADHHQRLSGKFLRDVLNRGKRPDAWTTPGRPEIDEHHLPLQ